jgi:hypothetical protein
VSSTAPGAVKAREALEWCRYGHQKMKSNPTGLEWVLTWAGTIALLRAVGHALVNEDAEIDARMKNAQRAWWDKLKDTKPNPSIFWGFIERDRNLLLHEAELTVGHSVEMIPQSASLTLDATPPGIRVHINGGSTEELLQQPEPQPPGPIASFRAPPGETIYNYKMKFGRFAGQDPRDLVRDAIKWWEEQLDDIEQKAAASSP